MMKMDALRSAFDHFIMIHNKYHKMFRDDAALQDSQDYCDSVNHEFRQFEETADWIHVASQLSEAAKNVVRDQHLATERVVDKVVHKTVNNEENTSVHTSVKKEDSSSVASFRSKSSSMASATARITAKKASLLAEAATLEEQHDLEHEELLLRQNNRALEIKVEIAKANEKSEFIQT